jgi:hypothetical protein
MMIELRFGWKKLPNKEVESKVITVGHVAGGGTNYGQMDFMSYIKEIHDKDGICVFASYIWGTGQWFRRLRNSIKKRGGKWILKKN